jgi:hypothetical protein
MLVMLGTIIFIWLIPDEYLYEWAESPKAREQ